jgi:iron complex outermembrane receptor protein
VNTELKKALMAAIRSPIEHPSTTHRVAIALLAFGAVSTGPAQAQNAPPGSAANKSGVLEEVVITGTRRVDRSATDSASPVDVISGSDINDQPTANMLDSVRNIVPSFFVGQNTISDASTFVRAPSLRGLPSDQVLVMLNGKRFNRSALVQVYNGGDTGLSFGSHGSDISSIPSIAIKRLEVLRDGATAQYGSDAIAGVLNYALRDDDGFEVLARYGQYKEDSDGESQQIAANFGYAFGDRGFVNLSGEYVDDGQTSRGVTRPTALAFAQENPNLANTLPHYPLPAQIWGNSPSHGFKFLLNSALDVTEFSKVYLFGNYAENHADQSFNFRSSLVGTRTFVDEAGNNVQLGGREFFQHPYYQTLCPANNATCPAGGYVQDTNVFNLSSIYPGGFTPRFVGDTKQTYATLGYKGAASSGLRYDLSVSNSRNSLDLSMYDSISPSYGAASQTSFKFGELIQKELDVNVDLSYEIGAGLASPLTLSGGAEYRDEEYEATQGDPQSFGAGPYATPHPLFVQTAPGVFANTGRFTDVEAPSASGYGGTSPTYAGVDSESSYGVYVGLEGDLTKRLSAGAAVRYEDYENSGDATVFKLNGIFKATDGFAIRATLGTGFHAPSPGQNNVQVLTTNFIAGVSTQTGTYPVTSAIAQFYGAQSLKPEKSDNYGIGVVIDPTEKLTLTADLYRIDVSDRIYISQTFHVTAADIAALPELASVGVGGDVQYFTNSLDTKTTGVDLIGTWRSELGAGGLNLTLAYNYNKNEVTKFDPAAIGPAQIKTAELLAPNHRANLQAGWTLGDFGVNVVERYYGTWSAEADYPGQEFGAKFTTDLDVRYTFAEKYTLTAGASNLFDERPDKIKQSATNPVFPIVGGLADGQVYPRNGGPFGINGTFWYASLRINFD